MGKKSTLSLLLNREMIHIKDEDLAVFENSRKVGAEIVAQGCVLLENDGTLPLAAKKVNVFGTLAASPLFGGGGSGAGSPHLSIGFYQALEKEGIEYNETLYSLYKNWSVNGKVSTKSYPREGTVVIKSNPAKDALAGMMSSPVTEELPAKKIPAKVVAEAKAYSEIAIVTIGRRGSEQHDNTVAELRLSEAEKSMLELVCSEFEKVIVIINAASVMELGFLKEYPQIKAALYIGFTGTCGMESVAKILSGKISPSGRLNDTFFYNIDDIPAIKNHGTHIYKGTENRGPMIGKRHFLLYKEDIYVGYRYAETFLSEDEYKAKIQYPFGYGLSYTSFVWSNYTVKQTAGGFEVSIVVRNAGECEGRDVVQIYVNAPYTGRVEKAERVLVGFAKTKLLAPGESECLTVRLTERDFASYSTELGGYIAEAGTYNILACRNAHEKVYSFGVELAEEIWKTDSKTGREIKNRLAHIDCGFTKLSRKDPKGTYPTEPTEAEHIPSEAILGFVAKKAPIIGGEKPVTKAKNGIMWSDLKGKSYDDPIWQRFVEQLSYKELRDIVVHGGWQTLDVPRLGVPEGSHLDGPAGFGCKNDRDINISFPSETILACTWNPDLAQAMGEALGEEAKIFKIHFWYGPAMNTHRSPIGGRCFEYYSEDPLLAGKFAAATVKGAQSKKLIPMCKHYVINEEDLHRMNGHMWCGEQAAREIYLRPFEIAIKEGGSMGLMSAINCVGEKWVAEDEAFMTGILRDEWGFEGCAITDSTVLKFQRADTGVPAGSDLWLTMMRYSLHNRQLNRQYRRDPNGIVRALQRAVKNVFWAHAHTDLMK